MMSIILYMIDKRILALLAIIAILAIGLGYGLYTHQDAPKVAANNTTSLLNNTTVKNATLQETTDSSPSGEYGYCAVCGNALTSSEANNEYTQGKVCHNCANNPYYQTGEGAQYANQKLFEAYPDEYSWMHEDDSGDGDVEYVYNDNNNIEDGGN